MALWAEWAARRTDSAKVLTVRWFSFSISVLRLWRNWAKMSPELPRAPERAASAIDRRVVFRDLLTTAVSAIERMVAARLVPVSASGTGKTLIRLRYSCSERPAWR